MSGDCGRFTAVLESGGYAVTSADTVEEMLAAARDGEPVVVLVGWLESCNRIRLIDRLGEVAPRGAVVVLFDRPDEAEMLAVLHSGAAGYLSADIAPARLLAALQGVEAGEASIPRSLTATLVRQLHSRGCTRIRTREGLLIELSDREWDVVSGLRQGYTTSEIAARLFVDPATVRSHVHSVVHKVGVTDRDAALEVIFSGCD